MSSRSSNSFPSPPPFLHFRPTNSYALPFYLLENEADVGGRLSSRSDSIQFRQSADKIRSGEKYGGPRFRFYVGSHQRREARAFMPRLQRARRLHSVCEREREGERKEVLEGRGGKESQFMSRRAALFARSADDIYANRDVGARGRNAVRNVATASTGRVMLCKSRLVYESSLPRANPPPSGKRSRRNVFRRKIMRLPFPRTLRSSRPS